MFKKLRSKIIFRITAAFVACVILPVLLFLSFAMLRVNGVSERKNLEIIDNALLSYEQSIWKTIYDYGAQIERVVLSPDIIDYINNPADTVAASKVNEIISGYTSEQFMVYSSFNFYTYKKSDYTLSYFQNVSTVENESWYRNFFNKNQESLWYPVTNDGQKSLVNILKIYDSEIKEAGILKVELDLEYIAYSHSYPLRKSSTLFVLSKDGQDIYFNKYSECFKDRKAEPEIFNTAFSKLHNGSKTTVDLKNTTVVMKYFDEFDIIIGCGINNDNLPDTFSVAGISIVFTMMILMAFSVVFYYYIVKIFTTLKRDIVLVEDYVDNNPAGRLSVRYNNEIGDIERQYNILLDKIEKLTKNIILKERLRKNSEIAMLQSQLNPHFIYNVINHFRMKAEINEDYEMADSIAKFGKLMRYNMMNRDFVTTIKEELASLRYYFDLETMRFSNQVEFNIDCQPNIDSAKVPKCILQPIVENSLKHGKIPNKILHIDVIIREVENDIHIIIRDNGKGAEAKILQSLNAQFSSGYYMAGAETEVSTKIGLKNINQRIRLLYDDRYHLSVNSVQTEYFEVLIKIPAER